MKKYFPPQYGVALLVALLVVALAALLIAGLLDRNELTVARTQNVLNSAQADAYMHGLEAYAARILNRDLAENGQVDTSSDIWAVPLPPLPVPGGKISATMRDLNGCFNLNNLVITGTKNDLWIEQFQRLLTALKLDPTLANVVVDWLDADAEISNGGAEDTNYLNQLVPFRTANRYFTHLSELRLLKGITGKIYEQIKPHVCTLPPDSKINLNTASVPVLMSVAPNMTEELAKLVWNEGHANFQSLSDVDKLLRAKGISIREIHHYSVESHYFLARGDIELNERSFTFYSMIERGYQGVRVLARISGGGE